MCRPINFQPSSHQLLNMDQDFDLVNFRVLDCRPILNIVPINDRLGLALPLSFVAVDFAAWSKIEIGEEREALQRWYDLVRARPAIC